MPISDSLRQQIAARDQNRCVYCLTTEVNCGLKMHIDHIVPEVAGGSTTVDNLCLACFNCNVYKGARHRAIDPETQKRVSLFHPVQDEWKSHFAWSEDQAEIVGLTPSGRATVIALQLNNPFVARARRRWIKAGWHPPDP